MKAPRTEETGSLIRITDADDPAIAEFRSVRDRDLTRGGGRFVAEGTVVLRMLAEAHRRQAGCVAEKLLLLENRVTGLGDILAAFPDDVPVYVADGKVLDQIVGFHLHRGVLAIGRRIESRTMEEIIAALPERALVVAAFGISNHDNIGAIFRNAAGFGADAVFIDETCCDPLYRKALRVSVGSILAVPYASGTVASILTSLQGAGFAVWGLSPAGATEIRHVPPQDRMALITGTEGEGLPPSVMSAISTARIAQMPGLDSLNAGTATGIALYEIAMAKGRLG